MVGPTITPTPNIAIAVPISSAESLEQRRLRRGEQRTAADPLNVRQKMSAASERDAPQKNEATTNSTIDPAK